MKETGRQPKDRLRIVLNAEGEQAERLLQLQAAFAQVCNALAPIVQKHRIWNRVALHHMAYRQLREQFPVIGSQMVCNAIYAVSRTSRVVYQHPQSPFNLGKLGERPLPLLKFTDNNPVYFDRHTLSLKAGVLSIYTLDGRMRLKFPLKPADEALFHERKLRELVLFRRKDGRFELSFSFLDPETDEGEARALPAVHKTGQLPDYVRVEEST